MVLDGRSCPVPAVTRVIKTGASHCTVFSECLLFESLIVKITSRERFLYVKLTSFVLFPVNNPGPEFAVR